MKWITVAITSLIVLVVATLVLHKPWSVELAAEVDVPLDAVFEFISNPLNLAKLQPLVYV